MLNKRGFSLLELTMGTAIAGTMLLLLSSLVFKISESSLALTSVHRAKGEMNLKLTKMIGKEIANIAIISPVEPMYVGEALTYGGFSAVNGTEHEITGCRYDLDESKNEQYSILRYTTFSFKESPIRTITGSTEVGLTDQSEKLFAEGTPQFENYQSDSSWLFKDDPYPPEVLILDPRSGNMRRYTVGTVDTVIEDDVGYKSIQLKSPSFAGSSELQPAKNVSFSAPSYVYSVVTKYLCVSSTTGDLITKEETTGDFTIIYPSSGVVIRKFKVKHLAFEKGGNLDPASFYSFPYGEPAISRCLSHILIEMEIDVGNGKVARISKILPINFMIEHRSQTC